jgi:hypothetical protein
VSVIHSCARRRLSPAAVTQRWTQRVFAARPLSLPLPGGVCARARKTASGRNARRVRLQRTGVYRRAGSCRRGASASACPPVGRGSTARRVEDALSSNFSLWLAIASLVRGRGVRPPHAHAASASSEREGSVSWTLWWCTGKSWRGRLRRGVGVSGASGARFRFSESPPLWLSRKMMARISMIRDSYLT